MEEKWVGYQLWDMSVLSVALVLSYVLTITQNICEGKKDVDVRMDAPSLMKITFNTVLPKVLAFGMGFPWRTAEFVVQDAAWIDLSGYLPAIPYFLAQCLVQS